MIQKCNMLNLFGWGTFSTGKGELNPQWVTISHITDRWKFKWCVTPSVGETVKQRDPKPFAVERTCRYGCFGNILALKSKIEHVHVSQQLYHQLYDLVLQDSDTMSPVPAINSPPQSPPHIYPTPAPQSDSIRGSSTDTAQEQMRNIWWSLLH